LSVGIDIHSYYEGHTMDAATFATRVCKLLGVETIIGAFSSVKAMSDLHSDMYIVTNAAGGLNQDFSVGDIVCLNDVWCYKSQIFTAGLIDHSI
jgi:purine-nucleoside phosphorylase